MYAIFRILVGFFAPILAALVVLTTGVGCRKSNVEPPPKTYPVKGAVVYKGGAPFVGGMIEFRSQSDQTLTMTSAIGQDGTFELFTIFGNQKLPGAIAGPCRVTVYPPVKDMKPSNPHRLEPVFTIEPKENNYTIELGPTPQKP